MAYFVFRNNTIERFFDKTYKFSGYEDISVIPKDVDGYIWWYQIPIKFNLALLAEEVREYAQKMNLVLDCVDGNKMFIALTIDIVYSVPMTDADCRLQNAVMDYNNMLYEAESRHKNVKVIDFKEFSRRYNQSELIDWKYYFISQMSINPKLSGDFKTWWNKKIDSICLKRKKCLVLDLDNTLWGGVLGEEGIEGIQIGGGYPGNAFMYWQKGLLELFQNGIILTICSKNNEKDILEVWDKNPFVILKKEHFATYRINWTDKATNIKQIAEELNIGLDSMVFIDDNPAERELVKQHLPMVIVPDFPEQPYNLMPFFQILVEKYFKVYTITEEDKRKTEQYKQNALRANAQKTFVNMDAFLESLDIKITIEEVNEFNIQRISQMTQKTNQFNLTTHRYSVTDIHSFIGCGWRIWCIGVSDKFGDNGITGSIMVRPDGEIDTMLMSCRILGKGIEYAFVKKIIEILNQEGFDTLTAKYIPTSKNSLVKDFWEKMGFVCQQENENGHKEYRLSTGSSNLEIKNYYKIVIKQS